jgi:uncharacterized protein (DUF2236 family)
MQTVRSLIQRQVLHLVGARAGERTIVQESGGDAGLFGPDSVCWRVHGDFTSMMIGGVTALLLQMLHPGALAGVWDHSNFREDMSGRLRRTARFIAGTTYGTTEDAEALIAHVRSIHDRVQGRLPDGAAYSANDPALLTWVHVAEVSSFLAAYLRYRDPRLSAADQDRYFAETATVAERLGATEIPRSRAEVRRYLQAVRPQLAYDARTREVTRALLSPSMSSPATAAFARLVFEAAPELLPDWAQRMHGLSLPITRRPAVRLGVKSMAMMLRWALPNGAEARARRRAAGANDKVAISTS